MHNFKITYLRLDPSTCYCRLLKRVKRTGFKPSCKCVYHSVQTHCFETFFTTRLLWFFFQRPSNWLIVVLEVVRGRRWNSKSGVRITRLAHSENHETTSYIFGQGGKRIREVKNERTTRCEKFYWIGTKLAGEGEEGNIRWMVTIVLLIITCDRKDGRK